MSTVLGRINWSAVNRATRREVRNREVYCPPISLFRWWARRPHALAGAVIKASRLKEDDLISDPFSGGGTVTLEAVTRGHRVHAQDLNPWPTWGLRTALDGVSPDSLKKGIDFFSGKLRALASRYYATRCPDHNNEAEILNTFWVRECSCPKCNRRLYLYPYSLITLASRNKSERFAFFGCTACGRITQHPMYQRVLCGHCGRKLPPPREPLFPHRRVHCPHCGREIPHKKAWARKPKWKPVLVQRRCTKDARKLIHFAVPTPREVAAALLRARSLPKPLQEVIPAGRETDVLRQGGFRRWRDLYPPRQLAVLLKAANIAKGIGPDMRVRDRIQLAIAGAGEMAGYLCRWDRFHPKVFEALANHRFAVLGLSVETNLAAEQGRGTLKRRLKNSLVAARWAQEHIIGRGVARCPRKGGREVARWTIVSGSSATQRISSDSVRLVVTDPPYYDAVQYGELSALFLVWARILTGKQRAWKPNLRLEALPNGTTKAGAVRYERLLCAILKETARTLHSGGRLLLTFHSTDFRGWAALGRALHQAGLQVTGLAVVHSENEKDHPKRNRNGFFRDLVVECKKGMSVGKAPLVVTGVRDSDQRELTAAGLTIARFGHADYQEMAKQFARLGRRIKHRRIRVPNLNAG